MSVQGYIAGVRVLMAESEAITAANVIEIEAIFRIAMDDILDIVPASATVNAGSIPALKARIARRINDAAVEFGIIFRDAVIDQQIIVDKLFRLYGVQLQPNIIIPIIGSDPEIVAISSNLSQELIRTVTRPLTALASRTLSMAALAPGARGFSVSRALNAALGDKKAVAARASRIYRTESLRLMSLSTMQGINEFSRVRKVWMWSHVERKEHAAIDGQVRGRDGFFRVPLREGGIVRMRYPRDPRAIAFPSATINCRCFVIPWPVGIPSPIMTL